MRVLLALDGSSASDAARATVHSIAWPSGSVIAVVGVIQPGAGMTPLGPALPPTDPPASRSRNDLRSVVDRAVASLAHPSRFVTGRVVVGRPATVLVEAATEMRAELVVAGIVMGSRGLTGLDRIVLGSVARNVLLHASTSVLIVHEPIRAEDFEAKSAKRAPEGVLAALA